MQLYNYIMDVIWNK